MSNPVLTPKAFQQSEVERGTGQVMTKAATANAIAILFSICAVSAGAGWAVTNNGEFAGWLIPAMLVAFGIAIGVSFKKTLAMPLGIAYAVIKGAVVGGFAHFYNGLRPGLPIVALIATGTVFALMWGLWAGGIIKVTARFRSTIIAATGAVCIMYLGSFIVNLFTPVTFLSSNSGLGILLSVGITALAAFNLCLDFDLIERGIQGRAPGYMAWYSAFGLLVTVVWLYMEMLRLLAKINRR
jgi:uncharacterized YccA/Bax inhibitor family protein